MLIVMSTFEDELPLSKAQQRRTWEAFMEGGTTHSGRAQTLPYVMRRCEREKIPYKLTAVPGQGYHIEPWKDAPVVDPG